MNCQHIEEEIINEMSSPRNVGGSVREGTRVVLKEITATLHNSTQNHPLRHKVLSKNESQDLIFSAFSYALLYLILRTTLGEFMYCYENNAYSYANNTSLTSVTVSNQLTRLCGNGDSRRVLIARAFSFPLFSRALLSVLATDSRTEKNVSL